MTERRIELAERTFVASGDTGMYPCPECKHDSVIGVYLVNETMGHMHTWYVCTFWPTGIQGTDKYVKTERCGWTGWTVPKARKPRVKNGLTEIKRIADLLTPEDRAQLYDDLTMIAATRQRGLT